MDTFHAERRKRWALKSADARRRRLSLKAAGKRSRDKRCNVIIGRTADTRPSDGEPPASTERRLSLRWF